jgi:hypothetical protein
MSRLITRLFPLLGLALAACDAAPVDEDAAHGATLARADAALAPQLGELRRATAPFQEFDAAVAAGYDTRITECFSDATAGGMGFHYGKVGLIDATVHLSEPEVLLYEPQSDGSFRLVGVEYIVPRPSWTEPEPPRLFGRPFHYNAVFDIWALHAWVWQHNPSGVFADWNPLVSCQFADRIK